MNVNITPGYCRLEAAHPFHHDMNIIFLSNDIRAEDDVNSFKREVTKSNVLDNFTLFD